MGIIRALTEFAAAAAVLHPDHRQRFDDLVRADGRPPVQSALTTVKSSSSSTSTSSPPASSISTS
jgi:hypothetical protein